MTFQLRDSKSKDGSATRKMQTGLIEFGEALADLADSDSRIVSGSADLKSSTLLSVFADRHPDRFFQFGISEKNMVSAAAGMATTGLIPYVASFASFAGLLCYENIRTDLAYPNMPVRIIATHSGISMGFFATSHHATEDIAAMRAVANLMVISPADGTSASALLKATVDVPQPIYFRLGRGRGDKVYDNIPQGFTYGKPWTVRKGKDLLIVATGLMVSQSVGAAEKLEKNNISTTVLDLHTIKPFPASYIAELAAEHEAVLIVEEHNVEGGLGTMVQEVLGARGIQKRSAKHGLRDEFAIVGPPSHCYRYYGLDPAGIALAAERVLDSTHKGFFFQEVWTDADCARVQREIENA